MKPVQKFKGKLYCKLCIGSFKDIVLKERQIQRERGEKKKFTQTSLMFIDAKV